MAIDLFSIGRLTVHGYGLMIGIGFLIGIYVGCTRAKMLGLSDNHVMNISIYVITIGFLGGKILYVIVNFKEFMRNPLSTLGSGGFVVYGGIVTGVLSIFVYCRLKKISFLTYMDIMSASVAINQGFGRIGCFLAGCCYGKETESHFGVVFPDGCLAPAGVRLVPTQLMSAAFDFVLAFFLIYITKKCKSRGMVSGVYLLFYGIGRFIVEFFRGDEERGMVGAISTSQFISIFMVIFAVGYIVFSMKKKQPVEYTVRCEA